MSQTTKRALEDSLKRLLQKKPLSKITVSEIAEDCGISRMTFYYHFKDIYDLVEWCCAEDVQRVLEGKLTFDTWQEAFLNIFQLVRENKPFVINILRGISREQLMNYVGPVVNDMVRTLVDKLSQGMSVSDEDKRFISDFYGYALVGVMLDWIEHDMREDPAAIVERTSTLVHGNITRALEAFRSDKSV